MSKFDECIDPRFNFSFANCSKSEKSVTSSKQSDGNCSNLPANKRFKKSDPGLNDKGFNDYLTRKLTEMLEENIKHVDCATECEVTPSRNNGGIQLFTGSEMLDIELDEQEVPFERKKKKKKKEKISKYSKDAQFDEAAVSGDWVVKQSLFYNS